MQKLNLNKIIADNLDKAKFQSKKQPTLSGKFNNGGIYLSDRAKATQFGQYQKGGQKCPKGYINIDGKCIKLDSQEYRDMLDKGQVGTMQGNRFWGNKSTLKPIVIYSSKDKDTQKFYDKLRKGDLDKYEALLELGQKYGAPHVSLKNKAGALDFLDPNAFNTEEENKEGYYRPHYDPNQQRIYLGANGNKETLRDQYVEELAHQKQVMDKGALDFNLRALSRFGPVGKNMVTNFESPVNAYQREYDRPGSLEYEAHKEIEPKLQDEYTDLLYDTDMQNDYYKFPGTFSDLKPNKTYKMGGGYFPPYHSYTPPRMNNGGYPGINLNLPRIEQPNPNTIFPYAYTERPDQYANIFKAGVQGRGRINDRINVNGGINLQHVSVPVAGFSEWKKPTFNLGVNYRFANGGGLLSRTVTCSRCGHSWKGVTGGMDPITCHDCGGMIKMEQGGDISTKNPLVNYYNKLINKYGPGGETTDGCPAGFYKHSMLGCIPIPGFIPNESKQQAQIKTSKTPIFKDKGYGQKVDPYERILAKEHEAKQVERAKDLATKAGISGAAAATIMTGGAAAPYIIPALDAVGTAVYSSPIAGMIRQGLNTTIGGVTGLTANNILTGLGAYNLANNVNNGDIANRFKNAQDWKDYTTATGETALDVAGAIPMMGAIKNEVAPLIQASKESGLLSNTYKINPWAFKANPEAYYRGVGKEGLDDILESGIIRSKKQHAYPEPYFSKGLVGDKYAKGYFAELTNEPMKGVGSFTEGDLIQTPINTVGIDNPNLKLYEKNWLRGYKEVPKPPIDFSKYLTQEEAIAARAQRLISQNTKPGWNEQFTPDLEKRLTNAVENHNPASDYPGEKLGANTKGRTATEVSKDANLKGVPLNEANKARVAAHETGHYYSNSPEEGAEWLKHFNLNKIDNYKTRKYLRGKNRTTNYANEIRERAAQLKDYIAQKNGIPLDQDFVITQPMLDDAIKNYVKNTGLDNTMSKMLGALKDKKGLLKTMNKYALGVIPATIGVSALQQKKQGGIIEYGTGGATTDRCPAGEYYDVTLGKCMPIRKSNDEYIQERYNIGIAPNSKVDESLEEGTKNSQAFLKNWYAGRVNDPRYGDKAKRRIALIDKVKIIPASKEELDAAKAAAYYKGSDNSIHLDPNDPESRGTSTRVHETGHFLRKNDLVNNINDDKFWKDYFGDNDLINKIVNPERLKKETVNNMIQPFGDEIGPPESADAKNIFEVLKHINYYANPEEINSRLLEFRRRYNIDPTKKYTPAEMKKIMDIHSRKFNDYNNYDENFQSGDYEIDDLFKMLANDPEKLAELNDKIVMNNSKPQSTAKYGGWLKKYYGPGGQTTDGCPPGFNKNPFGICVNASGQTPDQAYTSRSIISNVVNPLVEKKKSIGTPYKTRSQQVKEATDRANRQNFHLGEFSNQATISQGQASTPDSERNRAEKLQQYVNTHPYAKLNSEGELERTNWDRNMEGVADAYTPAAKVDRGMTALANGLEAAGYVTGAGELASAGYNVAKEALAKNVINPLIESYSKNALPKTLNAFSEKHIADFNKYLTENNLMARQVFGEPAYKSFLQRGPNVLETPQSEQLLQYVNAPKTSLINGAGENFETISSMVPKGEFHKQFGYPYFNNKSLWYSDPKSLTSLSRTGESAERVFVANPKNFPEGMFAPAGESSIITSSNPSQQLVSDYAGSRRAMLPYKEGFDASKFNVFEKHPFQGYVPENFKPWEISKWAEGGVTGDPNQPYHPITNPEGYKQTISPLTIIANAQKLPVNKPYQPSQTVNNAKAILSGADLTTGFSGNPFVQGANLLTRAANSTGDVYTAARYAMDGQWGNAAVDAGEAVVDFLPYAKKEIVYSNDPADLKGKLKFTKLGKAQNKIIKGAKVAATADDFMHSTLGKFLFGDPDSQVKYKTGGTTGDPNQPYHPILNPDGYRPKISDVLKAAQKREQEAFDTRPTIKQGHKELPYEKRAREQRLREQAQQNSELAQTMGLFTPSGSNTAAGAIGANDFVNINPLITGPIMSASRLYGAGRSMFDPNTYNPYFGSDKGVAGNIMGGLQLAGDIGMLHTSLRKPTGDINPSIDVSNETYWPDFSDRNARVKEAWFNNKKQQAGIPTSAEEYRKLLQQQKLKQEAGDILRRTGVEDPTQGGLYQAPSNKLIWRDPKTGEIRYEAEAENYNNFKTPELYKEAQKDLRAYKRFFLQKLIDKRNANIEQAKQLGTFGPPPTYNPKMFSNKNLIGGKQFPGFDIPDYMENLGADMPMYYNAPWGERVNVSGIEHPEQMTPYKGLKVTEGLSPNKYGGDISISNLDNPLFKYYNKLITKYEPGGQTTDGIPKPKIDPKTIMPALKEIYAVDENTIPVNQPIAAAIPAKPIGPENQYTGISIVDYLATKGYPGTKTFRKQLAKQYGVENYDFSGSKNIELLNKLRQNDDLLEQTQPSFNPISIEKMMQIQKEAATPKVIQQPRQNIAPIVKKKTFSQTEEVEEPSAPDISNLLAGYASPLAKGKMLANFKTPTAAPQPFNNQAWTNNPLNPVSVISKFPAAVPVVKKQQPIVKKQQPLKTGTQSFNENAWAKNPINPLTIIPTLKKVNKQTEVEESDPIKKKQKPISNDIEMSDILGMFTNNPSLAIKLSNKLANNETFQDAKSIFQERGISGLWDAYNNKKQRDQALAKGDDSTAITNFTIPVVNSNVKDSLPPPVVFGKQVLDKDRGDNNFYHAPMYVDLNRAKFGFKNRGGKPSTEKNGITETAGLVLTPFAAEYGSPSKARNSAADDFLGTNTIRKYKDSEIKDNNIYGGIDDQGNFQLGYGKDMKGKNLTMSDFRAVDTEGFVKDSKGNYVLGKETGNKRTSKVPHIKTDKGEDHLPFLVPNAGKDQDKTYGQNTGGKIVIATPDFKEKILVGGSLLDVDKALEEFKAKHKLSKVKLIVLDNGTYSRGFMKKGNKISSADWKKYEVNSSGGAGFYLKGQGYKMGGSVNIGDEMDVTDEEIEQLKKQGYKFDII